MPRQVATGDTNNHSTVKSPCLLLILPIVSQVLALPLRGEEAGHDHHQDAVEATGVAGVPIENQAVGKGLGGFLFPHLHAFGAFGGSTTDPADLAVGDHDPNNNATLQSLEPSLALNAGVLQGYVNGSGTSDAAGNFTFALEEGFLMLVDLPFGFEIRGGQFLNRFGFENPSHNHAWKFVDQNLVNGRFLNEGELSSQGGEIGWKVPGLEDSQLTFSLGGLPAHGHGKAGHGHGEESEFEAEGAHFTDTLLGSSWVNHFKLDENRQLTTIVSGAWGDNQFGRSSQVYGAGFEYLWREHGHGDHEHGGKSWRWRNEAMIRHIAAVSGHLPGEEEEGGHREADHDEEEPGHRASFDEFGIYSMLIYGVNEHIETGLRGGWVSGISRMGLDERYRVSPMVTWYLNEERTLQARLQYNWDHLGGSGPEHSIWFQIGFNWGKGAHHGHEH